MSAQPSSEFVSASGLCPRLSYVNLEPWVIRDGATKRGPGRGWRYLLWFWLCTLSLASLGGAVLEYLGPPPDHASRPEASRTRADANPPSVSTVTVALAPATPSTSDSRGPGAAPGRVDPAPSRKGPESGQASAREMAEVTPADRPAEARTLIVLHPGRPAQESLALGLPIALGLAPDQVIIGDAAGTVASAEIRFSRPEDHALARRLGQELAVLGFPWRIESVSPRAASHAPQIIEVWLPPR